MHESQRANQNDDKMGEYPMPIYVYTIYATKAPGLQTNSVPVIAIQQNTKQRVI